MLLVTGGAGFIGSNVVASLNEAGRTDIVVNDVLGDGEKWRNLQQAPARRRGAAGDLMRWLEGRKLDAVIHLGANLRHHRDRRRLVIDTNFRLSLRLLDWCTQDAHAASSMRRRPRPMATARQGFDDDWSLAALQRLRPLNLYGWSKHCSTSSVADARAQGETLPPQWAGLKFFNVFGPNEYHKGEMMSVVAKRVRRREGRQAGAAVQVASRRHRATATSGATSSMSTMRWR